MKKRLLILLLFLVALPVKAQLAAPQTATLAPPAITFFRVAIIPKQLFKSEDVANVAANEMSRDFDNNFYKVKVIKSTEGGFKVAMMVKIMFFEKDQADQAMEFLLHNPNYDNTKFNILVLQDDSY